MVIKAYILRECHVEYLEDKISFQKVFDRNPLFNVCESPNIVKIFQYYGIDFSNEYLIGEMTLSKTGWGFFKKNFNNEEWNEKDIEILNKINDEFKKEEDIWCECF